MTTTTDHADDLLAGFLAEVKDAGRSAFTVQTYRQNLRTFLHWCADESVQPSVATADELRVYLRRYPNDRTRRLHLAGLRQFYVHLHRHGLLLDADPTRAVDVDGKPALPLPRIKRRAPRVITDAEQDALFRAAREDLQLRVLLRLMRFSGLRVSEVVGHRRVLHDPYTRAPATYQSPGLRIRDVDLPRCILDVHGKGAQEDKAYLDSHTAALISRFVRTLPHQHPEAPLFQTADGKPRGTKWAFARFRELRARAGIARHLTLHMLRHTFLTRFLENGGNLRAAQRLARHRNLDTTLVYADYVADGVLQQEFNAHNADAERYTDDGQPRRQSGDGATPGDTSPLV